MFVALNGLENVIWPERITGFEIDVVLAENWPHDLPFNTDNLRLHCAVINLFPLEADPLHLRRWKTNFCCADAQDGEAGHGKTPGNWDQ